MLHRLGRRLFPNCPRWERQRKMDIIMLVLLIAIAAAGVVAYEMLKSGGAGR